MKRKGFTLIELIVVMAIIAILVLFGAPKYLEYVSEAKVTNIKTNIKELETASATYFMKRNELPIITGEVLTSEQAQGLSEDIYDKRGMVKEVLEGSYYSIDYTKLNNYLKVPEESEKYILHNSGKVYYLSGGVPLVESMEDYFIVTPDGVLTGLSDTYKALGIEAPIDLVVPEVIDGITVTSVGDSAFFGEPEFIIPEDPMNEPIFIEPIEWSITSIKLPRTTTSIGNSAFSSMFSLSEITIPDSVTTIGDSAFESCTSLKTLTLPKNLTTIGAYTFAGSSLESVVIPNSVKSIGEYAFYSCTSLKDIKLSENLTYIGDWAFNICTSLTNIIIPSSVTIIGDYAFSNWASTQTISVFGSGKTLGAGWSGGATVDYK